MVEVIREGREELDAKAVELITQSVKSLLAVQEKVIFAICGGTSVSGIFLGLRDADINWSKVHIFMVDERLVPAAHPDSNYLLAEKGFINKLLSDRKLTKENLHPFILDQTVSDEGVVAYEEELKKYGGNYDIVLLSSGEDGHIGALYPDHKSVKAESEHYIMMHDSPKPPPERMSMSRKLLLRAKVALLLFFGEGKKDALKMFLDDSVEWEKCPAKLVKEVGTSYVLTDQE